MRRVTAPLRTLCTHTYIRIHCYQHPGSRTHSGYRVPLDIRMRSSEAALAGFLAYGAVPRCRR